MIQPELEGNRLPHFQLWLINNNKRETEREINPHNSTFQRLVMVDGTEQAFRTELGNISCQCLVNFIAANLLFCHSFRPPEFETFVCGLSGFNSASSFRSFHRNFSNCRLYLGCWNVWIDRLWRHRRLTSQDRWKFTRRGTKKRKIN